MHSIPAYDLRNRGYAYIDIDATKVDAVRDGFKRFIERRDSLADDARWALTRVGEDEVDRGLWTREGGEKDIKSVLHFDQDLASDLRAQNGALHPDDARYLEVAAVLYEHLYEQAGTVLRSFDELFGTAMYSPFLESRKQQPYATTTLRNLWYPPVVGQKGAKPHLDRGLLTIHLGDEGGHLLALSDAHDTAGSPVSPPRGKALVFWGVKVLWGTHGRFAPLWHSSVTELGQERFALVQFNHMAIPEYHVRDAETAYDYYWESVHQAR